MHKETDTTAPTPKSSSTSPTTRRLPVIDNARAILITLVVLGHVLPAYEPRWASVVVLFLYSFHMYAFTVVSGYVSKPTGWTRRGLSGIAKLLATYLILAALHVIVYIFAVGGSFSLSDLFTDYTTTLKIPSFSLWWLLSLACWRFALPAVEWVRKRISSWPIFGITVALAFAGLLLGSHGKEYSWMRTLYYFPFFCFGYFAKVYGWSPKRTPRRTVTAVLIMALALIADLIWHERLSLIWFMARFTINDVEAMGNQAIIWRALAFVVSVVLTLCFFHLVPRSKNRLTQLGSHTLSIYLWQGVILLWAKSNPHIPSWIWTNPLIVVAITLGLILVFGYGPIMRATEWFFSFNWFSSWISSLRAKRETGA